MKTKFIRFIKIKGNALKYFAKKYNFDLSTISFLSKCKFIIVDEAQDINKYQYDLIKLIASKLNIPLILVGDPNQNIYQFRGTDNYFMINFDQIFKGKTV